MDDILASAKLPGGSNIHIATLSRKTIEENEACHLGYDGYFIFEDNEKIGHKGITILGKVESLEAGFRLIKIWASSQNPTRMVA